MLQKANARLTRHGGVQRFSRRISAVERRPVRASALKIRGDLPSGDAAENVRAALPKFALGNRAARRWLDCRALLRVTASSSARRWCRHAAVCWNA